LCPGTFQSRLEALSNTEHAAKSVVDQAVTKGDPKALQEAAQEVLMKWKDYHFK
jgi:hypothetical protein